MGALDKPYCASADVYSFGLILWQMAAHEKPFSWMGIEDLYKEVHQIFTNARLVLYIEAHCSLGSCAKPRGGTIEVLIDLFLQSCMAGVLRRETSRNEKDMAS